MEIYVKPLIKEDIRYTTLKKEWSIGCKDYITLGLLERGGYVILCGDRQLTYPVNYISTANDYFDFYVNKI